jgi:ribonucleotide reductase alpha subunit
MSVITTIIKRDGSREPFTAQKLAHWGQWAAEKLQNRVDWGTILVETAASLPEEITSAQLQRRFIENCLAQRSWPAYLMAGRLYVPLMRKEMYGTEDMPSVREIHRRLQQVGFMRELKYSDAEYAQVDTFIDHDRDLTYPHFQLDQLRRKYALKDRRTNGDKTEYETPQYVFMRMAMALAESQPAERRMVDLREWYDRFSLGKLNAPTPNYINLGTNHHGYASCCLYTTHDEIQSILAGEIINYTMTYSSAGIGSHLNTRSAGDPVRGGLFPHQGKYPYLRSSLGNVGANTQAGRGGAKNDFYSGYDPEVELLMRLKNPLTPQDRQLRGMDYTALINKNLVRRAARDEQMFLFNSYTAPDLYQAMFSGDTHKFETLYMKYENDPNFKKTWTSAREVCITLVDEALETGRNYWAAIDEINRHTPFKDPIHSSNLCVASLTPLRVRIDDVVQDVEIYTLAGQNVDVWNGQEWSNCLIAQTGWSENLQTVRVLGLDGQIRSIECTTYHKWYDVNGTEYRTNQLTPGLELEAWTDTDGTPRSGDVIASVIYEGRVDDTYCMTEPLRHRAVFNGILTGQCVEIVEPTCGYKSIADLHIAGPVAKTHLWLDQDGHLSEVTLESASHVRTLLDSGQIYNKAAQQIEVGDRLFTNQGIAIVGTVNATPEPEVAMCSIGGVVVSNIEGDDDYYKTMYYGLLMIDKCIHMSHYELAHIGYTAKQRLNAGMGMMDLAYHMARKGLTYDSPAGLREIHRVAETHMFFAIKASVQLARELGNAPWIHRTKWAEGWLPIDTYCRKIDSITDAKLERDWESLRSEVITQGGIRNSCLVAYMPGESSSKGMGVANSIYPIREDVLAKADGNNRIYWAARDHDLVQYQYGWDIKTTSMYNVYGVVQKFTDQAISADEYRKIGQGERIGTSEMLTNLIYAISVGMKTRYYLNSHTAKEVKLLDGTVTTVTEENVNEGALCGAGGCAL